MRPFNQPGRSGVYAQQAAIACSHPLATQVGLTILRTGGNAVDACIAASAVLGIAEPGMTGIGGDCFALLAAPNQPVVAINGSGFSPLGATREAAIEAGLNLIPSHSPWAVTIPGAVAAWAQLHKDYGQLSWQQILQPAIHYATQGVPVHERVAYDWQHFAQTPGQDIDTAATYLKHGQAYTEGDIFHTRTLAKTLARIATQGAAGFYQGPIATDMVAKLRALGGCHQMQDFAHMYSQGEAMYVTPVAQDFHHLTLWECPPNGQGIAAQIIVAIMAHFAVNKLTQTDYHHLLAEATKLAYQLRDNCLTDPDYMTFSAAQILAPKFIAELAASIDIQQAKPISKSLFPNHQDTTYLCCVDKQGLNVSFINSIFNSFGSAITAPASGILLHSRGASFNLEANHPNCLAPRKRPLHTIIPAMLTAGKQIIGPMGVMGGHYQACGQAHILNLIVNFGYTPQAALDAPRSFAYENKLTVESSLPAATIDGLQAKGHVIEVDTAPMGGGQCIMRQANGVLLAASDPRKDGLALGY
ncbi:MAG: gamma-glutamyltransferase family protein [Gammaproteobacteria bacterium]|jgi:gamma-glutamyltranspeptidase/glutathione hydrolase|nr:gamma-glutamyltransferase family protein [Gammaproteobacteria bacterium]